MKKLKLENMRPGEEIDMVIKRHWIIFLMLGLYVFFMIVITLLILGLFSFSLLSFFSCVILWLFFLLFLYVERLNHELDMYIITNNRIIGVEQIAFLNRTVSECNLGQVQEVNSRTKGFFANILNYGTILIQTAGNAQTLRMDFAPDSLQKSRKILNIVDAYRDMYSKGETMVQLKSKMSKKDYSET
ncbi:hypothetical protein CSB08_00595 [Candidatus Gracilibacteria bacterium]|nr:MAG: hypothetical protein CSB08_00595 [Candidatus Gracilibacteria bacterium]PIE84874.1 MAG: hypothetical protein CSA08_04930 [Candidatus Gracilibacteria bacterium]